MPSRTFRPTEVYSIPSVSGAKDCNCLLFCVEFKGGVGGNYDLVVEDGGGSKLAQSRVGVESKGCKVIRVSSGEVLQQDHLPDIWVLDNGLLGNVNHISG